MKNILSVLVLMLSYSSFAQVNCKHYEPKGQQKITVAPDALVKVSASESISGHQWSSKQDLERIVVKPAELGGINSIMFEIDTKLQRASSQTYTFVYKRPWEKEIVATCKVLVRIKE